MLDDFGAGYASISYLREMKFDAIKLDWLAGDGRRRPAPAERLLKGVLDLCASLNVPCVAEHIEEAGQLALLKRLGCRDGQGLCAVAAADRRSGAREMAATKLVPFDRRGGRAA